MEQAQEDCRRGVKNITEWLDLVLKSSKNQHGLTYNKFIGAEQEFNTLTYGIKGNIDATILLTDTTGQQFATALEIKTGKHHLPEYTGQVMIYSLLISERFLNANPSNILLYIMDESVKSGFEYLRQKKEELDQLILGRNELAKWH